jgi:hypothetical protein
VRLLDVDTGIGSANLKQLNNLYFNPDSFPVSTSSNLTHPSPSLLPLTLLATPANSLISVRLQLLKATVLAESSILYMLTFHRVLSIPVMSTDVR